MRRLATIAANATTPTGFTAADIFDRETQGPRLEIPAKGALITCAADLRVRFDDAADAADAEDDWHVLPQGSSLVLETVEEVQNFRCLSVTGTPTVIATLSW